MSGLRYGSGREWNCTPAWPDTIRRDRIAFPLLFILLAGVVAFEDRRAPPLRVVASALGSRNGCSALSGRWRATPGQPVRPEVVTYVLGTDRYLCLRSVPR